MRNLSAALFASLLVLLPLRGQAQPSFDCSKASTLIERTICADPQLSQLDGEMARHYLKRRAELANDERRWLIDEQKDWLVQRDESCGIYANPPYKPSDEDKIVLRIRGCLFLEYRRRIYQLDPPAPPPKEHASIGADSIVGSWLYIVAGGEMTVEQLPGIRFKLSIDTVNGPTFHICSVESDRAALKLDVLSVDIEDNDYSVTPPRLGLCKIAVRFIGDRAIVDADGAVCRTFCGARGVFQGEYRRVQK